MGIELRPLLIAAFELVFILVVLVCSEQNKPCEIGIIHIEKGIWINRDTILSNCEKCYQNDKVEMQKCKDIYLQHGYQNADDYQKLLAKVRNDIPKLIESIRKQKAPIQITRYFPEKYSLSSIPPDSLKKILNYSKRDLDSMEGFHLEEISSLLKEVQEKIKLYEMFQVLLRSETPHLSLNDLKMDNEAFRSVTYDHEFKKKTKAEIFVAYFNFFKIMKGSMDYDRFLLKTRESPILAIAFSIQENLGYDVSLRQPTFNPGLVISYLDTISSFSKEDLDIIFYSNYLYGQIITPIDKQIADCYDHEMKKCPSEAEKSKCIDAFKLLFPYESIQKYMTLIEIYGRNNPQMITVGKFSMNINANKAYDILKKIY
jgi:hypothetical protein